MQKVLSILLSLAFILISVSCSKESTSSDSALTGYDGIGLSSRFDSSATIEETVFLDGNGIKATVTSLTYDEEYAKINVVAENDSDQKASGYFRKQ